MGSSRYIVWALERWSRRFLAYLVILPVLLLLYPITAAGNALGSLYYRVKG